MAMLTAYYDDSGEHGQTKAVVMCGFVSTVDQWLLFERDWQFVLKMPQVDLDYMHMKEIRSGKHRFAKFKDNMDLQQDLFERLQTTLRVRTMTTFAGSILLDDYDRVNADLLLQEAIGPPVVVAAEFAIVKTMAWWKRTHSDKPIVVVVDQGMKHFGKLSDRIYKRYKFRIVPGDAKKTPPLQGSDLAAWEIPSRSRLRGAREVVHPCALLRSRQHFCVGLTDRWCVSQLKNAWRAVRTSPEA